MTNGDNRRDFQGRFVVGNPGGPGNPYSKRVAELRRTFIQSIGTADIAEMAEILMTKARMGDIAAIKLVLSYVLAGLKPVNALESANSELDLVNEWLKVLLPDDRARIRSSLCRPDVLVSLCQPETISALVEIGRSIELKETKAMPRELNESCLSS